MQAGLDGDLELGEFSLKALAGVQASFDGVLQHLKKIQKNEEAYQFGAVEVALRGSATSDSGSDTLVIDMGGPANQRLWQIRRLTVGGALWTSTVAGSALVVVSTTTSLTPALPDIADQAATLPNVATYSTGQIIVRNPNRLFVVFLTPTASTQYAVGGSATDLPDRRHLITTPD
jgi:hypothetical protein